MNSLAKVERLLHELSESEWHSALFYAINTLLVSKGICSSEELAREFIEGSRRQMRKRKDSKADPISVKDARKKELA